MKVTVLAVKEDLRVSRGVVRTFFVLYKEGSSPPRTFLTGGIIDELGAVKMFMEACKRKQYRQILDTLPSAHFDNEELASTAGLELEVRYE